MNYQKHYNLLIERAKIRSILPSEYKEKHHVIPRCMNGTDESSNLVPLFPEEHFLAHLLLVKIYPSNQKLIYAANMMSNRIHSNKEYAWLKQKFSSQPKEWTEKRIASYFKNKSLGLHKKVIRTDEYCKKLSNALKGRIFTNETRLKLSQAHKGKVFTEEHKKNISLAKTGSKSLKKDKTFEEIYGTEKAKQIKQKLSNHNKGKKHTNETKEKMSKMRKGKKQKMVVCPYCNKNGGLNMMKRYHFDNCKFKKD